MKNKKILIISLILLALLVVGGILLYRNWDSLFGSAAGGSSVNQGTGNQSGFPLQYGSSGENVRLFQEYLLTKDSACLPLYGADGEWGNETESCAVKVLGKNTIAYIDYQSYGLA